MLVLVFIIGLVTYRFLKTDGVGDIRQQASEGEIKIELKASNIPQEINKEDYVSKVLLVKHSDGGHSTSRAQTTRYSSLSQNMTPLNQDEPLQEEEPIESVYALDDERDLISLASIEKYDVERTTQQLSQLTDIDFVEPIVFYKTQRIANDPYYSVSGKDNLDHFQWNFARINLEQAWSLVPSMGKNEIKVAVIDTGVVHTDNGEYLIAPELEHVNFEGAKTFQSFDCSGNILKPRIELDTEIDDMGHGTHVTATIVQHTNNSAHGAGIAMNTTIIPIKVLHSCPGGDEICSSIDVADAIDYAVDQGADIINLSLGGPEGSKELQDAIENAYNQGVVIIAAAGNAALTDEELMYPAAYPETISVGATKWDNKRAYYSQFLPRNGVGVDLVAPGGQWHNDSIDDVLDQNNDGLFDGIVQQTIKPDEPGSFTEITDEYLEEYGYYCLKLNDEGTGLNEDLLSCGLFQGTSMAAPHVSGVIALMLSEDENLSPSEVKDILQTTAQKNLPNYNQEEYGAGLIDAYQAVAAILEIDPNEPALSPTPTDVSEPTPSLSPTVEPSPTASPVNSPSPSPVASPSVTPTPPYEIDSHDALINLTFLLDGVPYTEGDIKHHPWESGREIKFNITLLNTKKSIVTKEVPFVYNQQQGVYQLKEPLLIGNFETGPYIVGVKGPKHLTTTYCYYNQEYTQACTFQELVASTINYKENREVNPDFIFIAAGEYNSINLTKKPVLTGDLPISGKKKNAQDGFVDVKDYSYLIHCLGSKSKTKECLSRADLDYSSQVNNIDLLLMRKTLQSVTDQI